MICVVEPAWVSGMVPCSKLNSKFFMFGVIGAEMDEDDTIPFSSPIGFPSELPLLALQVEESDNDEVTGLLPSFIISEPDDEHVHQEDESFMPSNEEDTKQ